MNTSIPVRAAALVVSMLIACGTIDLIANYAYPEAPTVKVASAH